MNRIAEIKAQIEALTAELAELESAAKELTPVRIGRGTKVHGAPSGTTIPVCGAVKAGRAWTVMDAEGEEITCEKCLKENGLISPAERRRRAAN